MSYDEVIEVTGLTGSEELLSQIVTNTSYIAELLPTVTGLLIFFTVVVLCYFAYKFFRIFI